MKIIIRLYILFIFSYVNTFATIINQRNVSSFIQSVVLTNNEKHIQGYFNDNENIKYFNQAFENEKIIVKDLKLDEIETSLLVRYKNTEIKFLKDGGEYFFNSKKIVYDFSKNLEWNHKYITKQLIESGHSASWFNLFIPNANAVGIVGGIAILTVIGLVLAGGILGVADAKIKPTVQMKGYINECKELLGKARSKQLSLDELRKYLQTFDLSAKANGAFLHASSVNSNVNDCQFSDPPPVTEDPLSQNFIATHSQECVNRVNLYGCQVEVQAELTLQIRHYNSDNVVNQTSRTSRKPAVVDSESELIHSKAKSK